MQRQSNAPDIGRKSATQRLHDHLDRLLPRWAAEISVFAVVGGVQLMVDSLVFLGLTGVGQSIPVANVAGRVAGAFLGFALNGSVTFARNERNSGITAQSARFLLFWSVATAVSTVSLFVIDRTASLHIAWLAKPLVEACLAFVSFLASKHWIYR